MAEITEETLTAQVAACSVRWEPQLEDSIGVAIGGYRPHNEYCQACKPILWALAEIRRQRGQIEALVDVVKRYHEAFPSPESTTVLANLPAAAARDKRLKAEGAAEALRPLPCTCRAVGNNSEDAAVITCLRCRALAFYEAEAARLGGVA